MCAVDKGKLFSEWQLVGQYLCVMEGHCAWSRLLKQGIIWRVGDGSLIKTWRTLGYHEAMTPGALRQSAIEGLNGWLISWMNMVHGT